MSIRTSRLFALLPLLATSCGGARPDPLEGAMRASDEDSAIIEAAALDFLANGNCWEGSGKDGIVVIDETLTSGYVVSNLRQTELPVEEWRSDLENGLPALRERNAEERPIDWHFADQATIRDVVLRGEIRDAWYKAATLGKCITTFALPGIHADGQHATVVFNIAPEYHGRLFISSLRRVDGIWRVERRHDFEYL